MLVWKKALFSGGMLRYMTTRLWEPLVKQLLTQQIEPEKGLSQFVELVKNNPKDLSLLGRCLGMHYHYRSLLNFPDLFEQVRTLDPDSLLIPYFTILVSLEVGDPATATKLFSQVQALKKELRPIESLYKALLLRRMLRPLEALRLIDAFLQTEEGKGDLEALLEKLQLLIEANQSKEALELANKLLKDDPRNIEFRFYKAMALRGMSKGKAAVAELTVLLSDVEDPKRKSLIYLERARCREIDDLNEKLGDLEEAKKLHPSIEIDREVLISYYMGNKLENTIPLMEELEKKHKIDNDYAMLLIKGAGMRYAKKNYKEALDIYKRVRELAPAAVKEHFDKQVKILEDKAKF
eukprot:TRINITY_DN11699_c0_g1_i2.p1 TRINITY_DN11699_c0_g1~~TRINITY_DN11699_c0_g1_i2.p1  ORF type:complete len:351 (-),score=123.57 TRINITY_DN11699_c0_g1_i2:109-1161(-)